MGSKISFNSESDIIFIKYTHSINLEEGLSFIKELEEYLCKYLQQNKKVHVLLDTRGYKKEDNGIHDILAKEARSRLSHINLYLAVLNDKYNNQISANEYWFINEDNASTWLRTCS